MSTLGRLCGWRLARISRNNQTQNCKSLKLNGVSSTPLTRSSKSPSTRATCIPTASLRPHLPSTPEPRKYQKLSLAPARAQHAACEGPPGLQLLYGRAEPLHIDDLAHLPVNPIVAESRTFGDIGLLEFGVWLSFHPKSQTPILERLQSGRASGICQLTCAARQLTQQTSSPAAESPSKFTCVYSACILFGVCSLPSIIFTTGVLKVVL